MIQMIALQSGGVGNFVIIPLMFLVIYLFMIRPQIKNKNKKKVPSVYKQRGSYNYNKWYSR